MKKEIIEGRKQYFETVVKLTKDIPGSIVECGFGEGHTANMLLNILEEQEVSKDKQIWLFDSFEGFPEPSTQDQPKKTGTSKGQWNKPDAFEYAQKLKKQSNFNVNIVKGFLEDVLHEKFTDDTISLLHLDVDLYNSYKVCLNELYNKVSVGGIIMFDEYKSRIQLKKYPGAALAIDEFFNEQGIDLNSEMITVQKKVNPDYQKFYFIKK